MRSQRRIKNLAALAAYGACMLLVSGAYAVPVVGGSSGLVNPDTLIDFGTVAPTPTAPITTQFPPLTFSSSFTLTWSDLGPVPRDNVVGGMLINPSEPSSQASFTVNFGQAVVDALFNFRAANESTWAMQSLSGGSIVESTTFVGFNTATPVTSNFYGFTHSHFDAIHVDLLSGCVNFNFDNVQFNIPEPTTVLLLGLGLAALGFATRSRQ